AELATVRTERDDGNLEAPPPRPSPGPGGGAFVLNGEWLFWSAGACSRSVRGSLLPRPGHDGRWKAPRGSSKHPTTFGDGSKLPPAKRRQAAALQSWLPRSAGACSVLKII